MLQKREEDGERPTDYQILRGPRKPERRRSSTTEISRTGWPTSLTSVNPWPKKTCFIKERFRNTRLKSGRVTEHKIKEIWNYRASSMSISKSKFIPLAIIYFTFTIFLPPFCLLWFANRFCRNQSATVVDTNSQIYNASSQNHVGLPKDTKKIQRETCPFNFEGESAPQRQKFTEEDKPQQMPCEPINQTSKVWIDEKVADCNNFSQLAEGNQDLLDFGFSTTENLFPFENATEGIADSELFNPVGNIEWGGLDFKPTPAKEMSISNPDKQISKSCLNFWES